MHVNLCLMLLTVANVQIQFVKVPLFHRQNKCRTAVVVAIDTALLEVPKMSNRKGRDLKSDEKS